MVVLGLGSNRGDRIQFLRAALHALKSQSTSPEIEVHAISPLYESDALLPVGAPESWNRPFLNVNVLCKTSLSPVDLLKNLKIIEGRMGRKDAGRWAPREIDIDILAMGEQFYESDR